MITREVFEQAVERLRVADTRAQRDAAAEALISVFGAFFTPEADALHVELGPPQKVFNHPRPTIAELEAIVAQEGAEVDIPPNGEVRVKSGDEKIETTPFGPSAGIVESLDEIDKLPK